MNKKLIMGLCIIGLVLLSGCNQRLYDNFCKEIGYNNSDDHRIIRDGYLVSHILVKCDGKVQHRWECHLTDYCSKVDEYYECTNQAKRLCCLSNCYDSNGTEKKDYKCFK